MHNSQIFFFGRRTACVILSSMSVQCFCRLFRVASPTPFDERERDPRRQHALSDHNVQVDYIIVGVHLLTRRQMNEKCPQIRSVLFKRATMARRLTLTLLLCRNAEQLSTTQSNSLSYSSFTYPSVNLSSECEHCRGKLDSSMCFNTVMSYSRGERDHLSKIELAMFQQREKESFASFPKTSTLFIGAFFRLAVIGVMMTMMKRIGSD